MSSDTSPPATDMTEKKLGSPEDDAIIGTGSAEHINASGHPDQLSRQYGILSICGMALTVDNAWVVIGTSLTVSICKLAGGTQSSGYDAKQHITYSQWWPPRSSV